MIIDKMLVKSTVIAISCCLALTVAGCFGGDDEEKEIEVEKKEKVPAKAPKKSAGKAPKDNHESAKTEAPKSGKIPATAVINWQNFFKPRPNKAEREALETRLLTWKDSESPKELVLKGHNEMARQIPGRRSKLSQSVAP